MTRKSASAASGETGSMPMRRTLEQLLLRCHKPSRNREAKIDRDDVLGMTIGDGAISWIADRLAETRQTRLKPLYRARQAMELAGLEPATSWVRFKSTRTANPLQERRSGDARARKPLGYPALVRGFWGWDALHPPKRPAPSPLREASTSRPPPGSTGLAIAPRARAGAPAWSEAESEQQSLETSASRRIKESARSLRNSGPARTLKDDVA
jgi:hypothetical protein